MSPGNENALIKQCISGEAKAQRKLYDEYARIMFGVCLRYSNSYDDAKDVLQDGFVKVYTKLSQYNFKGSFEGWMKRIFINTALEHYRVNKHYNMQSDIEAAEGYPHHDYTLEHITRKEILAIMNGMAPGYRNVLNLYIIEGYSHAEIGELLQISEGTSKSQLSRARVLLQQAILKREK